MRLRMKLGPYKLRWKAKELSLFLIVLVCATILIWTWNKSPVLTSLLPSKNQLLQLSPDIKTVPLEPKRHVREDISTLTRREVITNEEERHLDKTPSTDIINNEEEHHPDKTPTAILNNKEEQHLDKVTSADTSESSLDFETVPHQKKVSSFSTSNSQHLGIPILICYGGAEEAAKHKHSPKGEKTGVVKSGSISTQTEETKNVILGEKTSEQEEKRVANQACNYAKGKWVIDDKRPLYSGFGCKQWLAPMWACRLMRRQDFAFEKLRWQPNGCEMEEFEGSKFLKRMQDKTLAFVGDSLGRQQFQSLMCMITAGKDSSNVLDVGKEYGLVIPPGGKRPNGWAYRFPSTNTTVLYYWSSSLCDLEPLNVKDPHIEYAMHLDRPPAFLRQFLHKIDVLVLNTGHHWNRGKLRANRWVMYVGGVPNTNRKIADMGSAKNFTIHSTVKWLDSQLPKHPHLKTFYRSISPRHFVNGDWNSGGSCDNTTPMSIGKEVLQEESSDHSAASATRGTGVKLLDITALSQVRDEGHISRFRITASPGVQDCLHWCLPGVPDTWNEILFAQI
ncbi:protein trichome birefringence-like 16 isoform X2 [Durio zibethinus]|uniref:Protein trichome birefringence-like 16 isoform X2 n=1 Tax=Durio zibethinus TaxID=66656 RepID=A0A6P5XWZ5_DURZI|nr:protein trichome birefringence-like 16 isoform X2 [Durio zibethinus]